MYLCLFRNFNSRHDHVLFVLSVDCRFQQCWAEESRRPKPWLLRALHRSLGGRFGYWFIPVILFACHMQICYYLMISCGICYSLCRIRYIVSKFSKFLLISFLLFLGFGGEVFGRYELNNCSLGPCFQG